MEEPDAFGSDAAFTLLAREELEELVRDRTEALENVMDTMVDVLLKLGPEGNIQLANAAVESRLGYDPDDVTGKPIDHLLADPGQADDVETLTGGEFVPLLVREGAVTDREVAFATGDGDVVPTSLSASVMRSDGRIDAIVCVAKDITERKAAEDRAEFLHSLLRHDLGNKLQLVDGHLALLEETDLSETQRDHVESVRKATEDATQLLEKIRMLNRLGDRDGGERTRLSSHLREAIDGNAALADRQGVTVSGPDAADATVEAGPLLTEVFTNLVENSLKHGDGTEIDVSVETDDDAVTVMFEDDGVGVPPEERERVFERGYSGSTSSGSGLGMYIVSEVVGSYGGAITVGESDVGGARFEVTLQR